MVFSSDSTLNLGVAALWSILAPSSTVGSPLTMHWAFLVVHSSDTKKSINFSDYSCSLCCKEKAEWNHHAAACKLTGVFSYTRPQLCTWLKMSMSEWGTVFNTKIRVKPKVKKKTKPFYRANFQDLAAKQWLKLVWTYFMSFFLSHNN